MGQLLSSKRLVALLVSVIATIFKDRLPITEDQLTILLTAIGSLIVGDSIKPIGKLTEVLKDPRVIAAIAAVFIAFAKDRFPIAPEDLKSIVYMAASWIVGYSIRPPLIDDNVDQSTSEKAS